MRRNVRIARERLGKVGKEVKKAVAYLRTSSKTNVGPDKDSDKRQLAAIEAYAKAAGYEIVGTYYDAAVSGADPVGQRSGFAEMLERLLANGARTIIVESPDRFARDLMVQLAGHDMLKAKGITLIAASAPTFFVEDTPTAVAGAPGSRRRRRVREDDHRRQAGGGSQAQAHRHRREGRGPEEPRRGAPRCRRAGQGAGAQEAEGRTAEPARGLGRAGCAGLPQ